MRCGKNQNLAHDVLNLASTIGALAADEHIPDEADNIPKGGRFRRRGFWMHGPGDQPIDYDFVCRRRMERGEFGPGTCGSIEITRAGEGAKAVGLAARAYVGNLHGLARQLSRDMTRLYGCDPGTEPGFQGARGRVRRRGHR